MLPSNVSICTTAACQQLGEVMRSALAPNISGIDPCTNIYECKLHCVPDFHLKTKTYKAAWRTRCVWRLEGQTFSTC
jgi:hypothetical protein